MTAWVARPRNQPWFYVLPSLLYLTSYLTLTNTALWHLTDIKFQACVPGLFWFLSVSIYVSFFPYSFSSSFFLFIYFCKIDYFLEQVLVALQQNGAEGTEISCISPPHPRPPYGHGLPIISIPHQSGTFVSIDEPSLTHHNHSKSMAYIMVSSWCCPFHELGQMYQRVSTIMIHTVYVHCPERSLYCCFLKDIFFRSQLWFLLLCPFSSSHCHGICLSQNSGPVLS